MWATPQTLFWPLLGWYFPKDPINNGPDFLLMLFIKSFIPDFSRDSIPEIIGMLVIIILALNWLKEKLYKQTLKTKKDSKAKHKMLKNYWVLSL